MELKNILNTNPPPTHNCPHNCRLRACTSCAQHMHSRFQCKAGHPGQLEEEALLGVREAAELHHAPDKQELRPWTTETGMCKGHGTWCGLHAPGWVGCRGPFTLATPASTSSALGGYRCLVIMLRASSRPARVIALWGCRVAVACSILVQNISNVCIEASHRAPPLLTSLSPLNSHHITLFSSQVKGWEPVLANLQTVDFLMLHLLQ